MNPMVMLGQMMKGGGSPQTIIQQMMSNNAVMNNPMAKNAVEMFQKGNVNGLQEMAQNLAKERGTTVEAVRDGLLQQFGMK